MRKTGTSKKMWIRDKQVLATLTYDKIDRLKVYYQNVRGLNTKTETFYLSTIQREDIDVFVITESQLSVK